MLRTKRLRKRCYRSSFFEVLLIKLKASEHNILDNTLAQVFLCEHSLFFKKNFCVVHLWKTAFERNSLFFSNYEKLFSLGKIVFLRQT